MGETESGPGFSRPQSVTALPEPGLEVAIEAKLGERENLALYLAVPAVKALTARLTLRRWRASGLQIQGSISATLIQTCVVTLEPMETRVTADMDRKFLPAAMLGDPVPVHELIVDPDGEDPPEPLTATLDLGAIVVEELVLNMDPYPRSDAAAALEMGSQDSSGVNSSPFSVLRSLTGRPTEV